MSQVFKRPALTARAEQLTGWLETAKKKARELDARAATAHAFIAKAEAVATKAAQLADADAAMAWRDVASREARHRRVIAATDAVVAAEKCTDVPPITGVEVRELRERLQLSQADLAALVGVTAGTLRNWEGKASMKPVHGMPGRLLAIVYRSGPASNPPVIARGNDEGAARLP